MASGIPYQGNNCSTSGRLLACIQLLRQVQALHVVCWAKMLPMFLYTYC